MAGIADLALGAAPIAGGALLGSLAGMFKGPDFRAIIKSDVELLKSLPEDSVEVRKELKRTIDERTTELIASIDRNRELRMTATSTRATGGPSWCSSARGCSRWCGGTSPHTRSNWMITFVVLVGVSVIIGLYAARGVAHVIRRFFNRA